MRRFTPWLSGLSGFSITALLILARHTLAAASSLV